MRKLIIATSLLAPAVASAGGYVIPNEAPRDLALAQAAVADQNGAQAIFLNTAALAGIEGLDLHLADEILVNRTTWENGSQSEKIDPQLNTPLSVAVSYGQKLKDGMAFGVGVGLNVPAGGSIHWPEGWAGQEAIQTVDQQLFAIGIGAAFQPVPGVRVGASYIRLRGIEELHQKINYLDHYGDAGIALAGGANTFGVAAEFRVPQIPLSFGANYSHGVKLGLDGDAHFSDVPIAFQSLLHDQKVTAELWVPNILFLGAAYQVIPNLKVMAAWNYERWSRYEEDKFVGADGFSVAVERNYNDAQVFRVAGEWEHVPFLPALTLRAGVLRSISDQPKDTLSPSLTDGNSTAISLGGGFNVMPELRIDLAWQHAFFDKVTADPMSDAFQGSYKTQVDTVSLGVNWRLDIGPKH